MIYKRHVIKYLMELDGYNLKAKLLFKFTASNLD